MKKIKKFLASANTGDGFVQFFDYINNPDIQNHTFILKGGPGTGKSTLMKKVGQYFAMHDYNVEYFYCSSDISSLDGVRIVEKNVSIVDGTAPHVREATMPAIKQTIINLGEYINEDVQKHEFIIEKQLKIKQQNFNNAYLLLCSAKKIFETIEKQKDINVSFNAIDFIKELNVPKLSDQPIFNRKLFADAITRQGITEVLSFDTVKNINITNLSEEQIEELSIILNNLGHSIYSFKNTIDSNITDKIIIPSLQLCITFTSQSLPVNKLNKLKQLLNTTIKLAGYYIEKAKYHHKKVEKYYIKNMDFHGLDRCCEKIIAKIENIKNII